jgi:hypothetical protein
MPYGYRSPIENQGVSYDLQYRRSLSQDGSHLSIQSRLQIIFHEPWSPPISIETDTTDNLQIEIQDRRSESSEEGVQLRILEFTGQLTPTHTTEKLIVEAEDSSGKNFTIHAKLPADLDLITQLAKQSPPDSAIDQYNQQIRDGDLNQRFGLIERASYALNTHQFFRLVNNVASQDETIRNLFHENIFNTLTNLLANDGIGQFTSVKSYSEFRNALRTHNQQPNLITYRFTEFLQNLVVDERIDESEKRIEWFISSLRRESGAIEEIPDNELTVLLAAVTRLADLEEAKQIVSDHTDHDPDWDTYTDQVDQAKSAERYQDRVERFRDLLSDASQFTTNDFGFALTHYLFWHSKKLLHEEPDYRDVRLLLLEVCQDIADDTSFEHLSEMATYELEMAKGYKLRNDNPDEAIDHFDTAMTLAGDENRAWSSGQYNLFLPALREKTWTQAEQLRDAHQLVEARDLLDKRIDFIEVLENVSPSKKERVLHQLRGFRNEIQGNYLSTNYQYQQALEAFNRAAGEYKQGDREGLFKGVVGRQYQIKALLAEVDAEFRKAADFHEQYVEELPKSKAARYHRGQAQLCKAKARLLDDDIDESFGELNKLKESERYLLGHEKRFHLLLEVTSDYRSGEISDISRVFDSLLQGTDESAEYPIDFSTDYVTGFLTILASQRLRKLPIDEELQDEIVSLALEEACYPSSVREISSDEPIISQKLSNISIESEWQLALPSYILDTLEDVRTNRQTTFSDYSGLVRDLVVPLEQHLAIVTEYHATRYWGSDWQIELEGDLPFALGDYFEFFTTDASEQLSNADEIRAAVDAGVVEEQPVTQLRNALDHGRDPGVSAESGAVISEEQFEQLYQAVTDLMQLLIPDTPVIGEVESTFGSDSYRVQLHWDNVTKRTWITCDADLSVGELYYLPNKEFSNEMLDINSDEIVCCKEERARSFILDS